MDRGEEEGTKKRRGEMRRRIKAKERITIVSQE